MTVDYRGADVVVLTVADDGRGFEPAAAAEGATGGGREPGYAAKPCPDDGSSVDESLRVLRELGLRPRRTIRVVLFTNEENGLRGGKGYAAAHGGAAGTSA